jgi:biopolymer transport protein TolQ
LNRAVTQYIFTLICYTFKTKKSINERTPMNIPIVKLTLQSGLMGQTLVVMFLLLSLWSWALIFSRLGFLNKISGSNKNFRKRFQEMRSFSEIDRLGSDLSTPMGQLAKVGAEEYDRIIGDARTHTKVKDWSFFLESQFTMAKERLESVFMGVVAPFDRGILILAMISSIAPFLGLLGTVWGIMNSFYEIGDQGSASLPVVAPGIAAALITTIAGLAVAIPALFFYNYCNNKAEEVQDEVEEFKELLTVRIRREIFGAFFTERQQQSQQYAAPQLPPGLGGY